MKVTDKTVVLINTGRNRRMKKSIFFIALIACGCIGFSQEVESYIPLHPDINVFEDMEQYYSERNILLFRPFFGLNEQLLQYNTVRRETSMLTSKEVGFGPELFQQSFWDPYTKHNYAYIRDHLGTSEINRGWYIFRLNASSSIGLEFKSSERINNSPPYELIWANNSPPYVQMDKGHVLISEYIYVNPRVEISSFLIQDIINEEIVWKYYKSKDWGLTDLFWLGKSWLLEISTPHIAGIANNYSIKNYKTGEEETFSPENIIGYGDGVILTSQKMERGFRGITVWNVEKEILYRDEEFPITQMVLDAYPEISAGVPIIYFSYFDYPYIYCNIGRVSNIGIPFCTLIMNLKTGETYISPETYHLLGIFEIDGE